MSRTAFVQMIEAYRETFGEVYPQRDPISVFKVLEECAAPAPTTQVAITAATRVNSGEVNKIIDKAWQKGWVHRDETRTSSGAKMLSLTEEGRLVLAEFERRCGEACQAAVSRTPTAPASRKVGKSSHAKRQAQAVTDDDIDALCGPSNKQE